ncbi:MAG: tetraacyldisaccharide 4'-kinase [Terriglobales bacterium]|jgi:tetraacyldisaccharide 4'-kinase
MRLGWLYKFVVGFRNAMFDREILRARRLSWPVVSVGNISVGGSGKTPFVIMLGELLANRGISFDVLSRGYRRSSRGVLTVKANGSPEEFGDEPLLIARKLSCPVIVGEDRHSAGLEAEEQYSGAAPNALHLLDDGFQHRQLHRDFNIVLLNEQDLTDELLPSGRLREPLSSLSRADAVVVDEAFPLDRLQKGDFQIWTAQRLLDVPTINAPVIAFCGIARPKRFFAELRQHGLEVVREIVFRDHHRYTDVDAQELAHQQALPPGSRLVTTEKDAINLGVHVGKLNPIVVPMRIRLTNPNGALEHMLSTITERRN